MSRIDGLEFLARALAHLGKPYTWGQKGPDAFDCSGLVTATLLDCGAPDWRQTHNAALLFDSLDAFHPEDTPTSGCLVFYGPPRQARHVMVLCGDGRVFGACGGNSTTKAPTPGACVQFRETATYRKDVLGFRRLPEVPH